jgi:hypothetical protein
MSSSAQAVGTVSNVAAEATSAAGDSAPERRRLTTSARNVRRLLRDVCQGEAESAGPVRPPEIGASGDVSGNSWVGFDGQSTTASGAADATAGGAASASTH